VEASSPINLLVLDEDNYNLYAQQLPYSYLPGPTLLGVANGTVEPHSLNSKPYTPTPSTLNPQPSTLKPEPYTLNPKPLNPKPETQNPKP
jgi:hypothetical protein